MVDGGNPLWIIERTREKYPVVMHGVSLSIGSAQGVDLHYLIKPKRHADRVEPRWLPLGSPRTADSTTTS